MIKRRIGRKFIRKDIELWREIKLKLEAMLAPSIAVAVRRMHDVGKSGWFVLIPIYNLVLAVTEGDKGTNEYGPDPKESSAEAV